MHVTSRWTGAVASTVMFFALLLGLAVPATAAPAQADAVTAAATCVYHVRYNNTPVQENPDTDSVARKYKHTGERVTGPCRAAYDTEGATWFTAVHCSCASDGIGWIRSYWLY